MGLALSLEPPFAVLRVVELRLEVYTETKARAQELKFGFSLLIWCLQLLSAVFSTFSVLVSACQMILLVCNLLSVIFYFIIRPQDRRLRQLKSD